MDIKVGSRFSVKVGNYFPIEEINAIIDNGEDIDDIYLLTAMEVISVKKDIKLRSLIGKVDRYPYMSVNAVALEQYLRLPDAIKATIFLENGTGLFGFFILKDKKVIQTACGFGSIMGQYGILSAIYKAENN